MSVFVRFRARLLIALGLVAPICLGEAASSLDARFEILKSGYMPGVSIEQSLLTLARNEFEYRAIWAQVTARTLLATSEPPKVDFGQSMVVAFFGAEGSNCDPYRLLRVIEHSDKLTLEIVHQVLGNHCTCGGMVAEPYILVRIGRTRKPLYFVIQSETHDCAKGGKDTAFRAAISVRRDPARCEVISNNRWRGP